MGIYSRDYYQEQDDYPRYAAGFWQGWQIIMGLTIAIFVLQVITYQNRFTGGSSIVTSWLCLDSDYIFQGQLWRVITYAFCHSELGIWHILFNMFALYFFGREIELRLGRIEFITFYLTAAIVAGLAEVLLAACTTHHASAVGASGSTMAIAVLFAYWYPTYTLHLYFIPVQARVLVIIYVCLDLHGALLQFNVGILDGIAHACHLGGALFGYLYASNYWNLTKRYVAPRWTSRVRKKPIRKTTHRPKHVKIYQPDLETIPDAEPEVTNSDSQVVSRMDEILAKIFEQGEASLTAEERAVMQEASRRLQKKKQ